MKGLECGKQRKNREGESDCVLRKRKSVLDNKKLEEKKDEKNKTTWNEKTKSKKTRDTRRNMTIAMSCKFDVRIFHII